ncbi:MAG TPA: hypothetical protein DDY82_04995 [Clostridiales bacterium]|nr:hypothetical protein [Clostridiales bacterium]
MVIFVRLFVVQIVQGNSLQRKAIDQWTRELPVIAKRGEITDRNGVVLASSGGTYSIYGRIRSIKDKTATAKVLSQVLDMDEESLIKKFNSKVSEVTVKVNCSKEEIQKLKQYDLDGIYFSVCNKRVYPYNDALCQILGYTTNDGSGQSGLEKYYDKYLKGMNGEILYESDLVGVDLSGKDPYYVKATNGLNLQLTIDFDVQSACDSVMEEAMEKYTPKSASVIVLDPNNGEILGISTKPDFSLNEVPRDDLTVLNKLSRSTLIVDSYEPGSTFKIITSAINIEEYLKGNPKAFSTTHIFSSSRFRYVGGTKIKCWSTHANGKHANENLAEALNNSCNPIFVDIALSLGKRTFYVYLKKFSFGLSTGIDYSGEAIGMLVSESVVTDNDLARIGFGQTIAVTPLQLVSAVASVINGGKYYVPHLAKKIYNDELKVSEEFENKVKGITIGEQTSKILNGYLEDVVTVGSGKNAYIKGYKVAGKTGTAQKYENGFIAQGKYVMSFVGFFPSYKPEYLALVIVDEPVGGNYGSTVSAPLCKEIFEKIIKVKNIKPKTE